jgi:hypothetical protein
MTGPQGLPGMTPTAGIGFPATTCLHGLPGMTGLQGLPDTTDRKVDTA